MQRRWLLAALVAGSVYLKRRKVDLQRHFADQGVVVTGGASGFGGETTRRLVALGARVLVVDRDATRLAEFQRELPQIYTLAADITAPEAPAAIQEAALRDLGRINLLYNNAGICISGPFLENTAEQLAAMVQINFLAHMQLTHALLPILIAQGGADIAFTASLAAWVSAPSLAAYSGTKAAIKQFAHALEREVGQQGIRVYCLYPNVVRTNLLPNEVFNAVPMKYGIKETVEALLQGIAKGEHDIFVNAEDRFLRRLEQLSPPALTALLQRQAAVRRVMALGVRDGRNG